MTAEVLREAIETAAEFADAQRRRDRIAEKKILKRIIEDSELADVFLRSGLASLGFLKPDSEQAPQEFQWWIEGRKAG